MHEIACIRKSQGLLFEGELQLKTLPDYIRPIPPDQYPDVSIVQEDLISKFEKDGMVVTRLKKFMKDDYAKGADISFDVPVGFLTSYRTADGNWLALPFLSNYRLFLFNQTTLSGLNLPLPTPHNLSQSEWTWPKLLEYAELIKAAHPVSE